MTEQCKYAIKDNKGILNCTKNNSTIGLCQQPCPYKATASASVTSVTTSPDKRLSRRFGGKKLEPSSVHTFFEVVTLYIEADGAGCHD